MFVLQRQVSDQRIAELLASPETPESVKDWLILAGCREVRRKWDERRVREALGRVQRVEIPVVARREIRRCK